MGCEMTVVSIAYELAGSNSDELVLAIKQLGRRWARPLASVWYVDTPLSGADIEARLAPILGIDDGLVIQAVSGEAAVSNTIIRWTSAPINSAAQAQPSCVIIWPGTRCELQSAA